MSFRKGFPGDMTLQLVSESGKAQPGRSRKEQRLGKGAAVGRAERQEGAGALTSLLRGLCAALPPGPKGSRGAEVCPGPWRTGEGTMGPQL